MAKKAPQKTSSVKKMTTDGLPAPIDRKYKNNFLKQVIARVDFAAPISALREGPPKRIITALKKQFPVPEQKIQILDHVHVTASEVQRSKQETLQWFYHSKERDKRVCVAADAMYVEYFKYNSFEDLKRDFLAVSDALFAEFSDLQVRRLGLRYINNIEFPDEQDPTDWNNYLDDPLLASFKLADNRSTISRSFHVLEFNYGDTNMRFQYGMPNPDYPAPIRKKLFTLDHDAYCTLLLGRDELEKHLKDFHDRIKTSFEQVITNGLRDAMGLIND